MADLISTQPGSSLFSSNILDLLMKAIGGTQDQNTTKTNTSDTSGTQTQDATKNSTGSTSTTGNQVVTGGSTGTTAQNTTSSQQTSGSQNTTGSQTANINQTTQKTADISRLLQVFQQQQAGITPEMLAAIFTEGSKAVPGLVSTMANAVGARSSNNTPLSTALGTLQSNLTSEAAKLSLAQRNASADTAGKIAEATSGTTTTGTNTTQNAQTTVNDQLVSLLANVLGNTNNTTNQTATTSQNTSSTAQETGSQTGTTTSNTSGTENTNNQIDTQPNYGNASSLIGALLGGSVLNQALPGGLGGALNSGVSGAAGLLKQLFGGGASGLPAMNADEQAMWDQIMANVPGTVNNMPDGTNVGAGSDAALNDLFTQLDAATGGSMSTTPELVLPDWWSSENWDNWFDAGW